VTASIVIAICCIALAALVIYVNMQIDKHLDELERQKRFRSDK
jgi:hypothetical protein